MAGEEDEEEKSKEDPIPNPHFPNSSKSLQKNRPFSDLIKNSKNDVVFPPIDHEGLPPSPPSQTLVPSPPPEHGGGDVARRWVRAKVVRVVSFWEYFCGFFNGGANGSFSCGAVTVAAVLVWWFYRRRRRRRDRMVLVIQEKDEKIKQLLHQIAQMNQLLLSLHKGASSQGGAAT